MALLVHHEEILGEHLLWALAIGLAAGVMLVLVDTYLLSPLESSVGLPSLAA